MRILQKGARCLQLTSSPLLDQLCRLEWLTHSLCDVSLVYKTQVVVSSYGCHSKVFKLIGLNKPFVSQPGGWRSEIKMLKKPRLTPLPSFWGLPSFWWWPAILDILWLSNPVSVTTGPSFFCIDFPVLFPLTTFLPYWGWTLGLILAKHSTTELYIYSVPKSAPFFLHMCHPNKAFLISSGDQTRVLMLAESSPQTPDFSFYMDARLIGVKSYFHDSVLIQSPLSRSYLQVNSQSQASTRSYQNIIWLLEGKQFNPYT